MICAAAGGNGVTSAAPTGRSASRRMPRPGARQRAQAKADVVRDQFIVALAEKGEVIGHHPFEERARFGAFRARLARLHVFDRGARNVDDLRPVFHRRAHVAQHLGDIVTQRVELGGVAATIDFEVNERGQLRVRVGRASSAPCPTRTMLPSASAPDAKHRMHDRMQREPAGG